MALTYMEMQKQISDLQASAEKIKAREVRAVIKSIREAIEVYNLTAADLGLETGRGGRSKSMRSIAESGKSRKAPKKRSSGVKKLYSDGVNSWTGHGRRPAWITEALAAGRALEDFRKA